MFESGQHTLDTSNQLVKGGLGWIASVFIFDDQVIELFSVRWIESMAKKVLKERDKRFSIFLR